MRYIDRIGTLPNTDADNALILGTALHTGVQVSLEEALKQYYMSYPIITDAHVNEAIKLAWWIPKVQERIPIDGQAEVMIQDEDFIGFIDWLVPANEECTEFDLYDFKYASNPNRYLESDQLHLYKYFFEKTNQGKKIRNMTYVIVPKVSLKPLKAENLQDFRRRIESELSKKKITFLDVWYEPEKVIRFLTSVKRVLEAKDYPENRSYLCGFCEYAEYCQKGLDFMLLPPVERRSIAKVTKRTIWIYGAPFSGKTYFANQFPNPLMLNTDGNIKFVDAPFIPIKDEVTVTGRLSNRTFAWDKFKQVIAELEKKQNDFETIIVDLLEDTYEQCRLYMYDKLGITHESDDSFRAWDKVRTEFLSTIRKLTNLDYANIIIISHEDTSKDITKKGGDKLTSIKPNITDKVANKVAGMVDLVARVVADGDRRIMSFKSDEIVFGGGRLTVKEREIPLDYDRFCRVYAEANQNAAAALSAAQPEQDKAPEQKPSEAPSSPVYNTKNDGAIMVDPVSAAVADTDPPWDDRPKKDAEEAIAEQVKVEEKAAADAKEIEAAGSTSDPNTGEAEPAEPTAPVRRSRRKRTE